VNRWSLPASLMLVLGLVASGVSVLGAATPAAAAPASGTYHAATPTRVLDTRYGTGAKAGPIPANQAAVLQVAGLSSVPTGASAVVLNVTVTVPTNRGYISVYPDGEALPTTSNLNFVAGQTVPSMVVVALPSNGRIRLHNGSDGSVQLIADVSGYYTGANAPTGQGAFGAIAPQRILDTRTNSADPGVRQPPVAPMSSVSFPVTGGGVPAGVSAVVLNVTVTEPVAPGFITAYPTGGPVPGASNLNFISRQTVPNLVVVPVSAGGTVSLFNGSLGTAHLLADISGYFLAGDPVNAGTLGALAPVRLLDTRSGGAATVVAPSQARTMSVTGRGGVPLAGGGAVVLNVTVTEPSAAGFLTVYGGNARPGVSNLNFVKGQTVPNLVVAQVSASGTVTFYNGSAGTVHVLADVSGYIPAADAPPHATSTSHYVRNITGTAVSDQTTMHLEGCADAQAGSAFVLLLVGAQSISNTPASSNGTVLSRANPGVRLTVPDRPVRLTYPQVRAAVDAYTQGFSSCSTAAVTVAVGTNSSGGNYSAYTAVDQGADWANEVVDKLTARAQMEIVGANDIEASFGSTYAQAAAWVTSYLAATTSRTSQLVYAGSADACPVTYGTTAECVDAAGQVGPDWTRANYVSLTHGLAPTRITALPQVYYGYQAVQWANIDVTARASGGGIVFAGVLTENASACGADCAMKPSQGWAALQHALSTVVTAPSIPVVTDLRVDV
jgi:hypothetical protein